MRWASFVRTSLILLAFTIRFAASNNRIVTRYVQEEEPKGTVVANMARILSLRYSERAGRTFKLSSQKLVTKKPNSKTTVDLIEIDESIGVLTLTQKIDREELCKQAKECMIQVQAFVLPNEHFSMLIIELVIKDVNDNAPTFPQRKIDITLVEGETVADDIIDLDKYQAKDDDTGPNGDITYTLTDNRYFNIAQYKDEVGAPHLGLRVLRSPDHEMESLHSLTIYATDHGDKPLIDQIPLQITVADANDHAPEFEQQEYPLRLPENIEISTIIVTVRATDRDSGDFGRVQYFLADSGATESEGLVSVDQYSGDVRLRRKLSKDLHDGLRIMIEARDSDPDKPKVGKAWLRLFIEDVNDHKPDINVDFIVESRNQTAYVPESVGVKTYIAYISATDDDQGANGKVNVEIRTLAKKRLTRNLLEVLNEFVLNSDGLLSTGRRLDRETYQRYIVEIRACDEGEPPRCSYQNVTIIVLDENDNTPVFSVPSKTVVLREDSRVGTVVTSVSASDVDSAYQPSLWFQKNKVEPSKNGVLRYFISDGDTNYFQIDETSGFIRLKKTLDHEDRSLWKLVITARDGGAPKWRESNCTVVIRVGDVNDNRPAFINPSKNDTQVYATILQDQPILIAKAHDRDNGANSRIMYKIIEEDGVQPGDAQPPEGLFIINPISGTLQLNFTKPNLTNFLGWHTIVIKASDSAESPLSVTTTLHIKVINEALPDPLMQAGFEPKFIVIVAVLSIASLILLALIAATLTRRWKKKQVQTYNCKTGKGSGRIWMIFPKRGKEDTDFHKYVNGNEADSKEEPIEKTEGFSSNQRRETVAQNSARRGFGRGQEKEANSNPLSLPIIRSIDLDSGRGDSGSENDDMGNSDFGTHNQSQHFQPVQTNRSNDDANSSRASELGPRCEESCLEFGHSDTCWLPSPENDSYRPPSLASHHSLRYMGSLSDHRPVFQYNCIDVDDSRVRDYLSDRPSDRYSTASTEYFQTLPAKTSDLYYPGFEGEPLETIDEGVPLGVQFGGGPDTYDVDDVSSLTNIRLATSPPPRFLGQAYHVPSRPPMFHIGDKPIGKRGEFDWEQQKYRTISCLPRAQYSDAYRDPDYNTSWSPRSVTPNRPPIRAVFYDRYSPFTIDTRPHRMLQPLSGMVMKHDISMMQNTQIPKVHLHDLSSSERTSLANDDLAEKPELKDDETSALMMNCTSSC